MTLACSGVVFVALGEAARWVGECVATSLDGVEGLMGNAALFVCLLFLAAVFRLAFFADQDLSRQVQG